MTNFQAPSESHSATDHRRAVTGQPLTPALIELSSLPRLGPLRPREGNGGSSWHLTSKVQKTTTPEHLHRHSLGQHTPKQQEPITGGHKRWWLHLSLRQVPKQPAMVRTTHEEPHVGWIPDCDEELGVPVMFGNSQVGTLVHKQQVKANLPHDTDRHSRKHSRERSTTQGAARTPGLPETVFTLSPVGLTGPHTAGKRLPWLPRWCLPFLAALRPSQRSLYLPPSVPDH